MNGNVNDKIEIPNDGIRIPAVIRGSPGQKLLIEVHGAMSNKEDTVMTVMAKTAVEKGYRVISFDLPQHGERRAQDYPFTPLNMVSDLNAVYRYARTLGEEISLFACSIGAFFSLSAYHDYDIRQALFLSPLFNMERRIRNTMEKWNIDEEGLKREKYIELPGGEYLDWEYYAYVMDNPVNFEWKAPSFILYGARDTVIPREDITDFSRRYHAIVETDHDGEHYYHTPEQLEVLRKWGREVLG